MNRSFIVLLVVIALAFPLTTQAKASDWTLLGRRIVNDRLDHDTLVVTAARGDFAAIKIVVRKAAVHFLELKVYFANGSVQDVSIRSVIPAGGESRTIDLPGGDRIIQKIEFWYEAQTPGIRRAEIRVLGRR